MLFSELTALLTVIAVDLVLAGDNAIVVGMAAAGLPPEQRRKAIIAGIAAAAALRIVFAVFTTKLLAIIGLTLAGGLLLLWVVWKLAREILAERRARLADQEAHGLVIPPSKSLGRAITQIVVADISMSLDNVLAVAGAARQHIVVLIIGLALSVALMGVAASVVANLLKRYYWISYVGLGIIAYIAVTMIWDGSLEVFGPPHPPPA
ncbi:MAG TPA: YjbE family putative metal transport protein [Bauldia sp.]|nr:YjbE family putative metal transport protein [Bauldia sp.]